MYMFVLSQFGKQRREKGKKRKSGRRRGKLYKIHGSKSERKLDILLLKFEVAEKEEAKYYNNNTISSISKLENVEKISFGEAAMVENVIISWPSSTLV
mgnify:CR=1 FL=1